MGNEEYKRMEKNAELHLAHKLQMRRIYVEKGLLAVLVILIAFCSNYVLETYKSQGIVQRHLLEKKIEAANEIREAHASSSLLVHKITGQSCVDEQLSDLPNASQLETAIGDFSQVIGANSLILSSDVRHAGISLVNLYYGALAKLGDRECDHRTMLSEVGKYLSYSLRKDIDIRLDLDDVGFKPRQVSNTQDSALVINDYFDEVYADWVSSR